MAALPLICSMDMLRDLDAAPVLIDVRASLTDPGFGEREYARSHLRGAIQSGFSGVFSAPAGIRGRNPWPELGALRAALAKLGIGESTPVVFYDEGAMGFAARALFCALWAGVKQASVLEGGWRRWGGEERLTASNSEAAAPLDPADAFPSDPPRFLKILDKDAFIECWRAGSAVVDGRPQARFDGTSENLDARPGHVPGALSRPASANFMPDGCFKPKEVLKNEWESLLAGRDPAQAVHMCGSGGAACVNILALSHAGLIDPREACLYPGSWSEWAQDLSLPAELGPARS